jgi:lipid II:glycine glycyltransferase (peptidoglycan interpeptide bridge formation enzyme)
MDLRPLIQKDKKKFNQLTNHVMQSWEWGDFKTIQGIKVLRYGIYKNNELKKVFQLTLHKIPLLPFYIGYLPKGPELDKDLSIALTQIGKEYKCAFIKIEPNKIATNVPYSIHPSFYPSSKSLFTKYNFVIDLTKTEEELLKNMHQKTRYNIKVAQKHNVKVEERLDDEAFGIYLKLYFETTKRQKYFGHNKKYHTQVWNTLKKSNMARLLIAFYTPPDSKNPIPLTAWMLMNFKDTLYYPYGGSSDKYRNVMAGTLLAWEAIKLGKKMKLKKFDLWGALNPEEAKTNHPWYGFHSFKEKLGSEKVQYLGTYDLIFNNIIYWFFNIIDKFTKLKIFLLKIFTNTKINS